jgi:hypothetical protein
MTIAKAEHHELSNGYFVRFDEFEEMIQRDGNVCQVVDDPITSSNQTCPMVRIQYNTMRFGRYTCDRRID